MEKAIFVAVACIATDLMGVIAVLAMTFASTGDIPIILAIQLLIGVLLIPGILRGKRLAWHGGGFVSMWCIVAAYTYFVRMPDWWAVKAVILASHGLLNFLLIYSLYSEGARRHFRLICPHSGSKSIKAKDLLFRPAQCRYCETIW